MTQQADTAWVLALWCRGATAMISLGNVGAATVFGRRREGGGCGR
jgi:hypothetical protein